MAPLLNDFDMSTLQAVAHRPWPLPDRPWVMTQSWHDLLFAHWRIDPSLLRTRVPEPFEIDLHDDVAWIGVVPFSMTNVAPRALPALPWLSAFPELNVRTYVRVGDRPGVYFFSLDAGRWLAVQAARRWLNLPYHVATMRVRRTGSRISYSSRRKADTDCRFEAVYQPAGPVRAPERGSAEYFLTERYCLYNLTRRGAPYRLDIHHPPWPLQPAVAAITRNTMAAPQGLTLDGSPTFLHFARRQDVVAWAPVRL